MPASSSFCVVIPMHDEESGAARCVRRVCAELRRFADRGAILIAVDDGSRDATPAILAALQEELGRERLIVVGHERNVGYGAALRTGAREAAARGFEYVVFMDSDLTNDPADLEKFVDRMDAGFGVVKASRYCPGSAVTHVPRWRRLISYAGNVVASALFGGAVRDCTNGFRAIRTDLLAQMALHENGFAIILEELYQATRLGATCCEIPYVLGARRRGTKPSSFVYRPRTFYTYLKYPVLSRIERRPRPGLPASR